MWKRTIDGRALTFRLAGINNQNFLMRDEETGSYWQQISGKAISGSYRGRQLELVHSDELTFSLGRSENPNGTILAPISEFTSKYQDKGWESKMRDTRTVVDTRNTPFAPRELMLGVEHNGASRAYVLDRVLKQQLVQDRVGGTPMVVVVGPDAKSVRVFEARIPGVEDIPEFYREPDLASSKQPDPERPILIDSATGSGWTFLGCAVTGPATGQCLRAVPALKDYWFDWQLYHPNTTVHTR